MAKKSGHIVGKVSYSAGDGADAQIPVGPCDIEASSTDVTISWSDGKSPGAAAIPVDAYTTYLTDGSITLDP